MRIWLHFTLNCYPPGAAGQFVRMCKAMGRTVHLYTEWRTSMLECITHQRNIHPPRQRRTGKRRAGEVSRRRSVRDQNVYGLSQCSLSAGEHEDYAEGTYLHAFASV